MKKNSILLCCFIMGCAPVYFPNARNAPLFDSPGEIQATLGYGTSYDAQVAFAATENLGFMANYSFVSRPGAFDLNTKAPFKNRNHLGEIGIGYIKAMPIETGLRNRITTELWAGLGFGKGSGYYERTSLFVIDTLLTSARFQRYFVQPTLAIRNKHADLIFTGRITLVSYSDATIESTYYNSILLPNPNGYFEPSAAYRLYWSDRRIIFTAQAGFNFAFIQSTSGDYIHHYPWSSSVALGLKLQSKKQNNFR